MATKSAADLAINHPEPTDIALYHGDLRKGAYLRRRAQYQTQAHAAQSDNQHGESSTEQPLRRAAQTA